MMASPDACQPVVACHPTGSTGCNIGMAPLAGFWVRRHGLPGTAERQAREPLQCDHRLVGVGVGGVDVRG